MLLILFAPYQFLVAPIGGVLFYFLFGYILVDRKLKELTLGYEYDSIEFFTTFLLFLKAGKPIKESLVKTCKIVSNDLSTLVEENLKYQANTLEEILDHIMKEMPSNLVCNMFMEVKEAYRNGNNLGDSIGMQLDFIRDKYRRNTINYYRYIPVRIGALCIIVMIFMALVLVVSS